MRKNYSQHEFSSLVFLTFSQVKENEIIVKDKNWKPLDIYEWAITNQLDINKFEYWKK